MLTLGYFFVLVLGPATSAVNGPFADLESCMTWAHYAEAEGGTASHCYAAEVPDMDDTPELAKDGRT